MDDPDREMARDAIEVIWTALKTISAAIGIFLVFALRSTFGCEPKTPESIIFKWYGNHCGPGYGDPEKEPIDELDAACKRHDVNYREIEQRGQRQ